MIVFLKNKTMNDLLMFKPYFGGDVYYRVVNLEKGEQNFYLFRESFSGIAIVEGNVWIEMQTNTTRNRFDKNRWIDWPVRGKFIDFIISIERFISSGFFEFEVNKFNQGICKIRLDYSADLIFYKPGESPSENPFRDFPSQTWSRLADVFAP